MTGHARITDVLVPDKGPATVTFQQGSEALILYVVNAPPAFPSCQGATVVFQGETVSCQDSTGLLHPWARRIGTKRLALLPK